MHLLFFIFVSDMSNITASNNKATAGGQLTSESDSITPLVITTASGSIAETNSSGGKPGKAVPLISAVDISEEEGTTTSTTTATTQATIIPTKAAVKTDENNVVVEIDNNSVVVTTLSSREPVTATASIQTSVDVVTKSAVDSTSKSTESVTDSDSQTTTSQRTNSKSLQSDTSSIVAITEIDPSSTTPKGSVTASSREDILYTIPLILEGDIKEATTSKPAEVSAGQADAAGVTLSVEESLDGPDEVVDGLDDVVNVVFTPTDGTTSANRKWRQILNISGHIFFILFSLLYCTIFFLQKLNFGIPYSILILTLH
jgi:hypothetical protein